MDDERYPSSLDNPRAASGDRARAAASSSSSVSAPSIMERFHAMLRERQEDLRDAVGEDPPPLPSAGDVVRCYEDVLAELTFNSKPIITELTMIAGQKIQYGKEIADAICARVLEVPVDQKLPSLYLIDSIVKNIGQEYVKIFATRLPKVFCVAYNQVHPTQRPSMRHLFKTWSQVFPPSVLQKIEDQLQFSPSDKQRSAGLASNRPSKSPSPCPSHGIHVNPKYLEARRQQSAADTPHERVTSTLKIYGQAPSANYSEYDLDQPQLLPQCLDTAGAGSPRATMVCASPRIGTTEPIPYLKNKISLPLSPPRIGLRRPVSPSNMRSHDGASRLLSGRASASNSVSGYAPGRASDPNGWLDRNMPTNEDRRHLEAPTIYKLNNGYGKRHPRELIDAYGNPRGRVSSHEKFPKVQRLDVNGTASEAASRKWKNSDEEEYVWEDMSPTLADRSRRNSLPPFGPSSGNFSIGTGFTRTNPAVLDSDFVRHSWPGHAVDGPSSMVEDRIAALGSQSGLMMKPLVTASQSESLSQYQNSSHTRDVGKFNYMLAQPTRQSLSPRSRSKASQMPLAARGTTPVIAQRLPIPYDNSPDIEVPLRRLSNAHADQVKVETSLMDTHSIRRPYSPVPAMLTPVHLSQSLPLLPIPPKETPVKNPLDILEPNKSTFIQVPEQQYGTADRKESDLVKFLHLPHPPPGIPRLSQHDRDQRIPRSVMSQETYGSNLPPGQAHISYSVGQPLNILPTLRHTSSVPSSFSTPSVSGHSSANVSLHLHGGPLPPLPPGPPPALSQMGPTSQAINSSSGSPSSAFSGLISSLMAQGLISLEATTQPQELLGVEFNLEHLKVRHESAINSLYTDLPRQCTTCGLRFKCQEEHSSHMDWHVTKNRISRNRKQKPSRKWFVSAKEWLTGAETLGTDVVIGFLPTESVAEKKEEKEVAVPADENQEVCALCGEPFEDFYSDDTEEWMYRGAVYLNAPDGNIEGLDRSQLGPIVHAKCRSGSNESGQG